MMKAVPLALLLASGAMAGPLEGTAWVVGAYPTTGTPANCCYLKPSTTITLAGTAVTAGTIDTTQNTDACAGFVGNTKPIPTGGASAVYADTLASSAAGPTVVTDNLAAGGSSGTPGAASATFATSDSGVTMTWTPVTKTSTTGTCASQTLTRAPLTISALSSAASYSAAAGTGANSATCCFFDTTQNVVFTPATNKVTVSGKLGGTNTQCSTTGSTITPTLKATSTAGTYADTTDATTYALSNEGKTITYTPATGCTQTLTLVSSSALRVAGTSAVVGATVLGFIAV